MNNPTIHIDANAVEGCEGLILHDGYVQLLQNPKWQEYEGKYRWIALANVGGTLAFVEVKIRLK